MSYRPQVASLANGGTNANLTASNGGIFYSTASAGAILSGTATANQILMSGSSTTPSWSTATYPATAGTSGYILASNGTNITSQSPSSVGASLILLSSQNASGASSLSFNLNSSYVAYMLFFREVVITTAADYIIMQLSTNGGSTYLTTTYLSGMTKISWNSTTVNNTNTQSGLILAFQVTSAPMSGTFWLTQVEESSSPLFYGQANAVNQLQTVCGGYNGTITANAFKLITNAASTFSGTFTLYGLVGG